VTWIVEEISASEVERAAAGEPSARDELLRALAPAFLNLACRMVPSSDAEDAAQEALLKVLGALPTFRGQSKFSTWAWSVASRSLIDYRRGAFRRARYSFDEFADDLADGLDVAAPERADDKVHLGQLMVGCARALLMCLDADHRLAYVLGQIMGLDGEDAAAVCGVSHAAYRKRLERARERVQTALDRQCGIVSSAAACRCHRRLDRAKELKRIGGERPTYAIDVAELRDTVQELQGLAERAAAYARADAAEPVPASLVAWIRELGP
jgi:RNA polymerase sigma factor (sigma-70 family)